MNLVEDMLIMAFAWVSIKNIPCFSKHFKNVRKALVILLYALNNGKKSFHLHH